MQPDAGAAARLTRVVRARAHLVMDEPFFGMLALRLKLVEDPSCATMWTDSVSLGYNPGYVDSLSDVELRGLIGKEVMHIAAGHPWRQDYREPGLWQKAGSLAIYKLLLDSGMRLPPGVPHDPKFDGLAAEAIYERISEPPPSTGEPEPDKDDKADDKAPPSGESDDETDGESNGDADDGDDKDGAGKPGDKPGAPAPGTGKPGDGPAGGTGPKSDQPAENPPIPGEVRPAPRDKDHEFEWKMSMEAAVRMQGDLPLGVQQLVAETLKSGVNWREVLWQFFETSAASPDYSWARPNPRYMQTGFFLPSLQGSSVRAMVVVRDTSGSVSNKYRQLMNGELRDILDTIKPEALFILDVDAAVHQVQSLESGDDEDFKANTEGGGGTDFRPAFNWVEEQGIDCACLVYQTDLHGTFPEKAPDYPVLWAVPEGVSRGVRPPFGEYIELELEEAMV